MTRADQLTRKFTTSHSFAELIEGQARDYRPTLSGVGRDARTRAEITELADLYDTAMAARGDPRRAWRGLDHKSPVRRFDGRSR